MLQGGQPVAYGLDGGGTPPLSTITATAPESPRIHCTCSAELVSYTGTVTAPALQIAKSSCTHS